MAAAFKLGVQKDLYDTLGQFGADDPGTHGQHIGVIVAAGHLSGQGIAAQGTANTLDLVGGDGNADAGGADDDAPVTLAGGDRFCGGFSENRIVTAFLVGTAEILIGDVVFV